MSLVLVERSFARPVDLADVQATEDRGADCLEAHGVRFLRTFFARDRRRMICLYDAPDAESVRLAERNASVPFDSAWSAREIPHSVEGPGAEAVVVERRLPEPMDEDRVREAARGGQWCLEQHGCRLVRSYLSADGKTMTCVFAAPDAESVRLAQRQSGLPFERVWPATVHEAPAAAGR
jgi:hypothetical protein